MKKVRFLGLGILTLAITFLTIFTGSLKKVLAIGGGGISSVTDGAVNCNGGNTCVKKIGDMAHVTYNVQTTMLLSTTDQVQSVRKTVMFVPKVLENVKITLLSVPDMQKYADIMKQNNPSINRQVMPIVPTKEVHKEIPIINLKPNKDGVFLDDQGNEAPLNYGGLISSDINNQNLGIYRSSSYIPDNQHVTYLNYWDTLDNLKNHELYYEYSFEIKESGVFSLKLEADVKIKAELTVLPIRVTNTISRCVQESAGNNAYEEFCQDLLAYDQWRRGSLPKYSLTDTTINKQLQEKNTVNGLLGCQKCMVTKENGKNNLIGSDVIKNDNAVFDVYRKIFALEQNPAISYLLNGVNEDGCDQAAAVVTLCSEEKPEPNKPVISPKPTLLTPATTTVKVESIWQDTKGQKIEAPVKEIEVELYRDDVVSGFKQKLKKANKWQVEFTDLAISESLQSKKEYQYTVKEIGEKDNLIKYGNKTYDVLYTGDMVKGFKVIHKERIEKPKQPHVDNHIVKTPNTSDSSFSLLSILGISLIALTFVSCKYMKKSH